MRTPRVVLTHNLKAKAFVWLWAKYVRGFNLRQHCTNAITGSYSRRLSAARNPDLGPGTVVFDEKPMNQFAAVYICGVAKRGYSGKTNYIHNLHTAIRPRPG